VILIGEQGSLHSVEHQNGTDGDYAFGQALASFLDGGLQKGIVFAHVENPDSDRTRKRGLIFSKPLDLPRWEERGHGRLGRAETGVVTRNALEARSQ
jgi:hypothetical protein